MTAGKSASGDLPKPGSERSFGLVFATLFALIGLSPLWHGQSLRVWALVLAGAFLFAALAAPRVLAPLNLLWFRFGEMLHKITSPILLGATFFLSVTPVAFVMRALGKDILSLRKDPAAESYWIEREPGPAPETMKHQF